MSWLELDDGILEHPKFVRAVKLGGSEAVHLWLGIRAYCGKHLTDGEVPDDMMGEVRGPRSQRQRDTALGALIASGLIERTETGIRMHDYLQWSTSRDEVLRRRESARERKARSRDPSQRDTPRDSADRSDSVTNPRGRDPTPLPSGSTPTPGSDPPVGPLGDQHAPRRSWRRVPEDWKPTDEHTRIAREMRVDLEFELAKFRDHEFAKPRKDPDAAFRNWLRSARKDGKPPGAIEHEQTRLPSNYKPFPVVRDVGRCVPTAAPRPQPPAPTPEELEAKAAKAKAETEAREAKEKADRERWEAELARELAEAKGKAS